MARISYVDPMTIDDEEIREFFEEAVRVGTPRPETQAIRAHQPDVIRAFVFTWNRGFRSQRIMSCPGGLHPQMYLLSGPTRYPVWGASG